MPADTHPSRLTECPDCGRRISPSAATCRQCRGPLVRQAQCVEGIFVRTLNYADFNSQADARVVLRAYPSDPNRLDAERDGIACERNPGVERPGVGTEVEEAENGRVPIAGLPRLAR